MAGTPFDDVLRSLRQSRRTVIGGTLVALSGFLMGSGVDAGKQRKNRKVKRNALGCIDVGSSCKHAGQCCSGICQGKKGQRTCRSHDEGTGCHPGLIEDGCGGDVDIACTTSTGQPGICNTTTGNAGYCIAINGGSAVLCAKDADCRLACGADAAACSMCEGQGVCAGLNAGGCGQA